MSMIYGTLYSGGLTTDYALIGTLNIAGGNYMGLVIAFTKGSSTGFRLKFEIAIDPSTYGQEMQESQSNGLTSYRANEHEYVATGNATIFIEMPIFGRWLKIYMKALSSGSGVSTTVHYATAHI